MKSKLVILCSLLALSLAALAACNDAIFATIDTEKKTATNTLSQTLSVYDIAVPSAGNYIVAAGSIFQGTLNTSTNTVSWTPNTTDTSRPWNPSGLICNAMALFNNGTTTNLYGNFFPQSATSFSLLQSSSSVSVTPPPFSFAAGAGVALTYPTGVTQATMICTANATAYLSGLNGSGTYDLDSSANGTAWTATNLTGAAYPFVGVAYDSAVPTYFTASNTTLYSGVAPATFSPLSFSGGVINGVFATTGMVIVTTKGNGVYYSTNQGGAWTQVQPDHQGSVTVSYLCAAGPIATNVYLVGSDGYGYYTLNTGAATLSRYSDSTTALYSASVSRIVLDTLRNVVLMGTNSKGLWRTIYDATSGNVPLSGQSWINE